MIHGRCWPEMMENQGLASQIISTVWRVDMKGFRLFVDLFVGIPTTLGNWH